MPHLGLKPSKPSTVPIIAWLNKALYNFTLSNFFNLICTPTSPHALAIRAFLNLTSSCLFKKLKTETSIKIEWEVRKGTFHAL